MSDERTQAAGELSPIKRALLQLKEMRARVEAAERARSEPIAIVGMGCRFPGGANGPDAFWRLLAGGVDAITEVPAGRWDMERLFDPDPDTPGKMCTRYGGFLDHIDRFDAAFFDITPREAAAIDPQQRMLLEVAWEALEHGGLPAQRLFGEPVGVFVGLTATDYLQLELRETPTEQIDPYFATGGSPSVASGRVSYVFGFQGPSITIETACSSSLVAVHLAAQSLRARECDVALAGGDERHPAAGADDQLLARAHAGARRPVQDLRRAGRRVRPRARAAAWWCSSVCRTRERDGDRILAVIRGSAVNQDGRSSGLTAPNGTAQQPAYRGRAGARARGAGRRRLRRGARDRDAARRSHRAQGARRRARRANGRPIGRCSSARSRRTSAISRRRPAWRASSRPCSRSSTGRFRRTCTSPRPIPLVDWTDLRIAVPTAAMPWPRTEHPMTAGVSSFGFSGTNAHIVIQEPPPAAPRPAGDAGAQVLTLSARSEPALRRAVADLAAHLRAHPDEPFADVCHTRNAGRSHFAHRLALVASTAADAGQRLRAWLDGDRGAVHSGVKDGAGQPQVAFLFAGQGEQYHEMGRRSRRRNRCSARRLTAPRRSSTASSIGRFARCSTATSPRCCSRRVTPSPRSLRSRWRSSSCGSRGGFSPTSCSDTASPRTWRRAPRVSSRSRTDSAWWPSGAGSCRTSLGPAAWWPCSRRRRTSSRSWPRAAAR